MPPVTSALNAKCALLAVVVKYGDLEALNMCSSMLGQILWSETASEKTFSGTLLSAATQA